MRAQRTSQAPQACPTTQRNEGPVLYGRKCIEHSAQSQEQDKQVRIRKRAEASMPY